MFASPADRERNAMDRGLPAASLQTGAMKDIGLWLSIGENCLGNDVLRRFGLHAPSTPYSSARSNLDHVLQLERNDYEGFLDDAALADGVTAGNKPVSLSKSVASSNGMYRQGPNTVFEFTHIDPRTAQGKADMYRRVQRMLDLRRDGTRKVFLYHHRGSKGFNSAAVAKLSEGAAEFLSRHRNASMVFFTQLIVPDPSHRAVTLTATAPGCVFFNLATVSPWGGNDPDMLWARKDNDLLTQMLAQAADALPA